MKDERALEENCVKFQVSRKQEGIEKPHAPLFDHRNDPPEPGLTSTARHTPHPSSFLGWFLGWLTTAVARLLMLIETDFRS